MTELITLLRSLSFGGLVGAGVGGIAALKLPQLGLSLDAGLLLGAIAGTAMHQLLDRIFSGYIGYTLIYYSKVTQILLMGRTFGAEFQRELLEDLTREHFLGQRRLRGNNE